MFSSALDRCYTARDAAGVSVREAPRCYDAFLYQFSADSDTQRAWIWIPVTCFHVSTVEFDDSGGCDASDPSEIHCL
jgi:hypothetical protein